MRSRNGQARMFRQRGTHKRVSHRMLLFVSLPMTLFQFAHELAPSSTISLTLDLTPASIGVSRAGRGSLSRVSSVARVMCTLLHCPAPCALVACATRRRMHVKVQKVQTTRHVRAKLLPVPFTTLTALPLSSHSAGGGAVSTARLFRFPL